MKRFGILVFFSVWFSLLSFILDAKGLTVVCTVMIVLALYDIEQLVKGAKV